jgi:hypothetical protein
MLFPVLVGSERVVLLLGVLLQMFMVLVGDQLMLPVLMNRGLKLVVLQVLQQLEVL